METEVQIPKQGSFLTELAPHDTGAQLRLIVPAGVTSLSLRILAQDAAWAPLNSVHFVDSAIEAMMVLPLACGVWVQARLVVQQQEQPLCLSLPQSMHRLTVLAQVSPAAVRRRQSPCFFRARAAAIPPVHGPCPSARKLAADIRNWPDGGIRQLSKTLIQLRHRATERKGLVSDLLAELADDPGPDPQQALPFLMLLADGLR